MVVMAGALVAILQPQDEKQEDEEAMCDGQKVSDEGELTSQCWAVYLCALFWKPGFVSHIQTHSLRLKRVSVHTKRADWSVM